MKALIYAIAISVALLALLLTNFVCSALFSILYAKADPNRPETERGKELIRLTVLLAAYGFIVGNIAFYFVTPPAWTEKIPVILLLSALPVASFGVFALAVSRIKTKSDQQELPGFLTLAAVLLWFTLVPLLYRPLVPSYSGNIFDEIEAGQNQLRSAVAALPWNKPDAEPAVPADAPAATGTPLPIPDPQRAAIPTVAPFPTSQPSQEIIDALIRPAPNGTPAVKPEIKPAPTPDPLLEFAQARRSEPFANPYVSSCTKFGAFRQPPAAERIGGPVDLQYLSNSDNTISFKWRCPGGASAPAFFSYFCCSCSDGSAHHGKPAPGGLYRLKVEPQQDYAWIAFCEKPYNGPSSNYHVARLATPGTRSYFRSYSFPRQTFSKENKHRLQRP